MSIEIINRQKIKKLVLRKITSRLRRLLTLCRINDKTVSFVFCDDKFIISLNKKLFHRNRATDVIAINLDDQYLGEVIVSVERAVKVCARYGQRWQDELALYLVHGVLHLVGYDDDTVAHKARMFRKQEMILRKL